MRQLIVLLIMMCACVTQSCSDAHATASNKKTNIIFILADDLGYGDVGFNGQKKIKTPLNNILLGGVLIFSTQVMYFY